MLKFFVKIHHTFQKIIITVANAKMSLYGKLNILLLIRIYSSPFPLFTADNTQMYQNEYGHNTGTGQRDDFYVPQ